MRAENLDFSQIRDLTITLADSHTTPKPGSPLIAWRFVISQDLIPEVSGAIEFQAMHHGTIVKHSDALLLVIGVDGNGTMTEENIGFILSEADVIAIFNGTTKELKLAEQDFFERCVTIYDGTCEKCGQKTPLAPNKRKYNPLPGWERCVCGNMFATEKALTGALRMSELKTS